MAEHFYGLEISYRRNLAFVFVDPLQPGPAAAVETRRGGKLLPKLERYDLRERVRVGDELFAVFSVSGRELCRWLNAARDDGAVLTLGPDPLVSWWLDGVFRIYPVDLQRVGLRTLAMKW